jgi:hypothetical protein
LKLQVADHSRTVIGTRLAAALPRAGGKWPPGLGEMATRRIYAARSARGSSNTNVEPSPSRERTQIRPFMCLTSSLQM